MLPAEKAAATDSVYRQAMESFNLEDYARALALLERAPEAEKASDQADMWNLRGAIYLHLHRYEQARTAFATANAKDPELWAARYNQAEVSFRQGRYAESSRQFEALLSQTSGAKHAGERGFLQYKLLLSGLLAGKDKPTLAYIEQYRSDRLPPLTYYYLNAALEQRRGRRQQAEQWMSQADAHYSPASEQVFAESFRSLGWSTERSERLIAAARRRDASSVTPAAMAMVELMPGQTPAATAKPPAAVPKGSSRATATSLPDAPKPAFRMTAPMEEAGDQEAAQMPPPDADDGLPQQGASGPQTESAAAIAATDNAAITDPRAVFARPIVLGKPSSGRKAKPSTPAASDGSDASAASPAGSAADASASPAAKDSLPAATPSAAFLKKYEEAYVKFLEKNYEETAKLLDEADAIQPKQPTSLALRSQIFKHYYEGAYMAFKRQDYPAAINQLDEADGVQANQPDALNLRGLTLSKQKDFERAESMFKRAIQADPTFWAAKFNYAELPFNYRNYTAARSRFEELYSQTDASKQPREAELTQFKVFLTLLLEGKVDGARSFMQHFSFSGSTPARYFCQSALEFYAGNMDKAQAEIDQANREYPSQLVSIFKESFYRIGWLNDVNNPANTALAAGASPSPGASPEGSPAGSPAMAAASPGASPSASPAAVAVMPPTVSPTASPLVAAASPSVKAVVPPVTASPGSTASPVAVAAVLPPFRTAAAPSPSASPIMVAAASPVPSKAVAMASPSASPVVAAASPVPSKAVAMASPSASPVVAAASPIPSKAAVASPSASPVVAAASPVPSKAVAVAPPVPSPSRAVSASPTASPLKALVPVPAPSLAARSPTATPHTVVAPTPTAVPALAAAPASAAHPKLSAGDKYLRLFLICVFLAHLMWMMIRLFVVMSSRKPRRTKPVSRAPLYTGGKREMEESDEVEAPR